MGGVSLARKLSAGQLVLSEAELIPKSLSNVRLRLSHWSLLHSLFLETDSNPVAVFFVGDWLLDNLFKLFGGLAETDRTRGFSLDPRGWIQCLRIYLQQGDS